MKRSLGLATVLIPTLLAGVLAACGSAPTVTRKAAAGGDALGDAGSEALGGSAGDNGSTSMGDQLNVGANNGVGGGVPIGVTELALEVSIDKDLILVTGTPVDVAAHAQYEDGSLPKSVIWSVDDTGIGSINQDGVFEANGLSAGSVTITAQAGSESASVPFSVAVKLSQNPDNISAADQAKLVLGGSGGSKGIGPDAAFRFLYPYDNTVFPRGLLAPALQFGGGAASSLYVKITTTTFSYAAFSAAGTPTRLSLP
ncbi:MAG TPA: Ig-like domain-containing protein, partial [Polyangiaceae bacterium]